jgi:DNA-binding MarR family transcriptional regulator
MSTRKPPATQPAGLKFEPQPGTLQAEMVGQIRRFSVENTLFNQKVADRVGLHLTDMQCMNLLSLMGTSTPGQLAENTGLTTGGVTVMLDRLEKAGYIKREPNPEDRRSVLVRVNSKKMEKIYTQHYAGVKELFHAVLMDTPDADLETIRRFFERINTIHPVRLIR